MAVLHNSKSANIFNFLAMNRVITQISKSVKTDMGKDDGYLFLSNSAFLTFFSQLNEKGVKYIVVGSMAVAFHGVIMPSKELEIWIDSDEENIKRTESVVNEQVKINKEVIEMITNSLGETFPLKVYRNLNYFPAKKFNWCYVKSETSVASGISIPILSLDDLIVEKTASNAPEDMEIVEALENMSW